VMESFYTVQDVFFWCHKHQWRWVGV